MLSSRASWGRSLSSPPRTVKSSIYRFYGPLDRTVLLWYTADDRVLAMPGGTTNHFNWMALRLG